MKVILENFLIILLKINFYKFFINSSCHNIVVICDSTREMYFNFVSTCYDLLIINIGISVHLCIKKLYMIKID